MTSSKPLYFPINDKRDTVEDKLGRTIYEEFSTVVWLREQVRVTDPEWLDLLQHVRQGSCRASHMEFLRTRLLDHPDCPPTDFSLDPWRDAVLVTPRHSVRVLWNTEAVTKHCRDGKIPMYRCMAEDTIEGRALTSEEQFQVANEKASVAKQQNRLSPVVELAKDMKVMVTFNVGTKVDLANGTRGTVVDIVLDERSVTNAGQGAIVDVAKPPLYVLVKLDNVGDDLVALPGLERGVLPVVPMSRTIPIQVRGQKRIVSRRQLPMTPGYAFTDCRSQGQTIPYCIVDIAKPPSGNHTPFAVYVALSRSHGRDHIRLLRDFPDAIVTTHPSEHLRSEDERLKVLDEETKKWWAHAGGMERRSTGHMGHS